MERSSTHMSLVQSVECECGHHKPLINPGCRHGMARFISFKTELSRFWVLHIVTYFILKHHVSENDSVSVFRWNLLKWAQMGGLFLCLKVTVITLDKKIAASDQLSGIASGQIHDVQISTSAQLCEMLYTDSQHTLVLSTVASRYYNCCTDCSTSVVSARLWMLARHS
jgi:hypothetical protein